MSCSRTWLALLACAGLSSCAGLGDLLLSPGRERPVRQENTYLAQAEGPQTAVDLGEGSEQLLTRFQTLLEEKDDLQQRHDDLQAEVDALRSSLNQEQVDRDKELRLRAGAEAEIERLRRINSERELKILHLQMQLADAQRSKLILEIAGIERQIEQLDQTNHAAMPPEGR